MMLWMNYDGITVTYWLRVGLTAAGFKHQDVETKTFTFSRQAQAYRPCSNDT